MVAFIRQLNDTAVRKRDTLQGTMADAGSIHDFSVCFRPMDEMARITPRVVGVTRRLVVIEGHLAVTDVVFALEHKLVQYRFAGERHCRDAFAVDEVVTGDGFQPVVDIRELQTLFRTANLFEDRRKVVIVGVVLGFFRPIGPSFCQAVQDTLSGIGQIDGDEIVLIMVVVNELCQCFHLFQRA